MRTERDVRENPVAGDVWQVLDSGSADYEVHARLGGLVGYEAYGDAKWVTLTSWRDYHTAMGRALNIAQPTYLKNRAAHIAQPGGEA